MTETSHTLMVIALRGLAVQASYVIFTASHHASTSLW